MKKFTDEQIIKIFKYCNESDCDDCFNCYNCAARQDGKCAIPDLGAQVLQVINRKNAEIEQWKEEADRWQNAFCKVNEDMSTIKSEAIKEFAERLKRCIRFDDKCEYNCAKRIVGFINYLIKEMTEDNNEH